MISATFSMVSATFPMFFSFAPFFRQKYERKRKTPSMTFSQCQRRCFSSLPLKTCGEQPHFVSSLSTGFICNSHFLFLYEHTLCRINREGRNLVEKNLTIWLPVLYFFSSICIMFSIFLSLWYVFALKIAFWNVIRDVAVKKVRHTYKKPTTRFLQLWALLCIW